MGDTFSRPDMGPPGSVVGVGVLGSSTGASYLFGKSVTYVEERRFLNNYKNEDGEEPEDRTVRTGNTREARDGDTCWQECEEVTNTYARKYKFTLVEYEDWTINTTLQKYYDGVNSWTTGTIGAGTSLGGGAATGVAASPVASTAIATWLLGDAAATGSVEVLGAEVAATAGAASSVLTVVGVGFAAFYITTNIMDSAHPAGVKDGGGWQIIAQEFLGERLWRSGTPHWVQCGDKHPCAKAPEKVPTGAGASGSTPVVPVPVPVPTPPPQGPGSGTGTGQDQEPEGGPGEQVPDGQPSPSVPLMPSGDQSTPEAPGPEQLPPSGPGGEPEAGDGEGDASALRRFLVPITVGIVVVIGIVAIVIATAGTGTSTTSSGSTEAGQRSTSQTQTASLPTLYGQQLLYTLTSSSDPSPSTYQAILRPGTTAGQFVETDTYPTTSVTLVLTETFSSAGVDIWRIDDSSPNGTTTVALTTPLPVIEGPFTVGKTWSATTTGTTSSGQRTYQVMDKILGVMPMTLAGRSLQVVELSVHHVLTDSSPRGTFTQTSDGTEYFSPLLGVFVSGRSTEQTQTSSITNQFDLQSIG